jgi:hypothetical protein
MNNRLLQGSATLLTGLLAVGSLAMISPAMAGNGALLGVQVGYPSINFIEGAVVQGASYNGTQLVVTSTPVFLTFTAGGTAEFISGGSLNITANINNVGTISGGTFSISGSVTNTATNAMYSGVLLSGTVTNYGIIDLGLVSGATDLADFAMNATAGSMLSLVGGSAKVVNVTVALEGSTFAGSFGTPWSAARSKGDAGPPPVVPEVPPATIGYWKNHPEVWAVTSLTICGNVLNQAELLSVLNLQPKGDVTIIMAHQLIAAMLGVAAGNTCALTVPAEAWLCSHGGIGGNRKNWDGGEPLKNALDQFNQGGACSL